MAHVFISYSKNNKAYARKLAEYLKASGFDVWIDDRIDYGSDWWDAIDRAIAEAGAVIVIMSPDSKISRWVQREITLAESRNKPVFPFLLEGDNWSFFVRTHYVAVTNGTLPPPDFLDELDNHVPRSVTRGVELDYSPPPETAHSVNDTRLAPTKRSKGSFLPFTAILIVMAIAVALTLPGMLNNSSENPTPTESRQVEIGQGEIAFSSLRDRSWEILVMNSDGTNLHNLTNNTEDDRYPSWSPDGRKIAFQSDREGHWEIYVMNSDGTNSQNFWFYRIWW